MVFEVDQFFDPLGQSPEQIVRPALLVTVEKVCLSLATHPIDSADANVVSLEQLLDGFVRQACQQLLISQDVTPEPSIVELGKVQALLFDYDFNPVGNLPFQQTPNLCGFLSLSGSTLTALVAFVLNMVAQEC
ncbi:MAG: hypothetical protein HY875_15880 [Chloroflexi bacterium]|nr:hypothetical protein [Chloroflexota bacterium]